MKRLQIPQKSVCEVAAVKKYVHEMADNRFIDSLLPEKCKENM